MTRVKEKPREVPLEKVLRSDARLKETLSEVISGGTGPPSLVNFSDQGTRLAGLLVFSTDRPSSPRPSGLGPDFEHFLRLFSSEVRWFGLVS